MCSFCPDKSGEDSRTTPCDYSLIVEIAFRACEHKDLISCGTKYLGIYDRGRRDILYTSSAIFNSRHLRARSAVANLWARGHYTRHLCVYKSAFIANDITKFHIEIYICNFRIRFIFLTLTAKILSFIRFARFQFSFFFLFTRFQCVMR